jgi:hypothetical protein
MTRLLPSRSHSPRVVPLGLRETSATRWLPVLLLALVAGCASPDVNPAAARPGYGYVDLYTVPRSAVWWKVDVYDPDRQNYKEFTAQFQTPGDDIFRVQARPGKYKARISFVNQAIESAAEVEVEVRVGMITPVEVKVEKGDTTSVRVVEDRAKNIYRNKVTDYTQTRWRISAMAEPAVPYTIKQNSSYWK